MLTVMSRGSKARRRSNTRAFTLVELFVVLGAILLLISLALPSLRGAVQQSREVRELASLRSNIAGLTLYLNDNREVFPHGHEIAFQTTNLWPHALVAAGVFREFTDADPVGARRGDQRFLQSACMALGPDWFDPSRAVDEDAMRAEAIRLNDVRFPSRKGWLVLMFYDRDRVSTSFCCAEGRALVPVAMTDGSCGMGRLTDYTFHHEQLLTIGQRGVPILSTWGGCRSFDIR